ncbi:MAG TPA: hypothetical protein PLO59_00445, partial [Bacteroidia bacterium]|nr:hypothetical protein [Bacteroidia bacterium]
GAAGIGFATKNKNLWHLFAELEIAPQNFSTGKFIFSTPTGTVSSGTYTKNGSSINIGATYFLTRSKTAAALNSPSAYVYAQDSRHFNKPIDSAALVQLFKRNQLEFNLGLRLNAHTTPITSAGPAPEIKGVTGPAIQFGYTINYHLKHALKIEAAFSSINYKYDNIYFYDSLNMKPEFFSFEYAQTYVGLGVNYLYRYPISRSILWFGESGMQVQFLTEGKHNSQIAYRIYSLDENCLINRSVTKTMVPAAKFGTGLLFATRNYNMWRIGLAYQHAFNKPISEDYFFQNTSTIRQQGSTKINASGFTATIGYIYSIAPSPYAIAKHRLKNK